MLCSCEKVLFYGNISPVFNFYGQNQSQIITRAEFYVGGNEEYWVCPFFGYFQQAFGQGNVKCKQANYKYSSAQIYSIDSEIRANSFRVVLVHDTRSNDSRSNNARFMHKLFSYVHFTGAQPLRGEGWQGDHGPPNLNFQIQQGPLISVSNIKKIAFYRCSEIIRSRNFKTFLVYATILRQCMAAFHFF